MLLIIFAALLLPYSVLTLPSGLSSYFQGPKLNPVLEKLKVDSYVRNRYARTIIQAQYKNPENEPQEVHFDVVLPDQAFITEFIMFVKNKEYKGYVREKKAAKQEYTDAVNSGLGAAHVAESLRDSNEFTVSVNVDAQSKVSFNLTYEHLLEKKHDMYELVLHLHPNQIVDDFSVKVNINETRPVINIQVPEIQNEKAVFDITNRNKYVTISDLNPEGTEKQIKFTPTVEQQKDEINDIQKFTGRFIVRYEVVSNSEDDGELITSDGHFVHFFSPKNVPLLDRNVVFVLDISGSMMGEKIRQLKKAMKVISGDSNENDYFSVVAFDSVVEVLKDARYWETITNARESKLPKPMQANVDNIYNAQKIISNMEDRGTTNIENALIVALRLANMKNINNNGNTLKPIIIFLTDGQPNEGEKNPSNLIKMVKSMDTSQSAIFTLGLGNDVNQEFLKDLATNNYGFMRKIYEASDIEMQLKTFYDEISSPLLANVQFKYDENELTNVTQTYKHIIFKGSEFVTAGVLNKLIENQISVEGLTKTGPRTYNIKIKPVKYNSETKKYGSMERLWAYLTIQKLLKNKNSISAKKEALDLALKYSFVTPITSLVVVKPNGAEEVDLKKINILKGRNVNIAFPPKTIPTFYSKTIASTTKTDSLLTFSAISPSFSKTIPFATKTDSLPTFSAISPSYNHFDCSYSNNNNNYNNNNQKTHRCEHENTLENKFPWISPYVRNTESVYINNTIYFVGDKNTSFDYQSCQVQKENESGVCTLLINCNEVCPKLVSYETYINDYMCPLKIGKRIHYLGVCCPI